MTPTDREQYRALRATIRERGTARVWIFLIGVVAWAALTVAIAAVAAPPIATLIPLVVLAATFESVYALHVGVERIGRYLAVCFDDGWEHAAMAFGRPAGAARIDALFVAAFAIAALCNLVPALAVQPTMPELVFIGGAHALFGVRLVFAKLTAGRQRTIDADRFRAITRDAGRDDTK